MVEVMKFFAPWCGPCHVIEPLISELEKEFYGKININRIDVDKEADMSAKFGVQSIPTLIFVKNGKEVDRVIEVTSKENLKSKIEKALA